MTDRPPETGPTPQSLRAQTEFTEWQRQSLDEVREAAAKWRDGLGVLVTLLTTAWVIAAPSDLTRNDSPAVISVVLVTAGIVTLIATFLLCLSASAGHPAALSLADFHARGSSRLLIELGQARVDAQKLRWARIAAVVGLACVLIGLAVISLTPRAEPGPQRVIVEQAAMSHG